ncbi:MAG TPA: hypothetical protein VHJ38_10655 [Nitrososphaeraceae archaeon]|jgi:hypothetical protein|nr:hypothetical protein [Nitrososphaeraceae archaeon]
MLSTITIKKPSIIVVDDKHDLVEREDGTVDIGWHDFHRVFQILRFQVSNHTTNILTYWNAEKNEGLTIYKLNRYNVDYFHELLDYLQMSPRIFIRLAFGREES